MMTVPVAFLVGLMAGSAIGWIARGPLADSPEPLRTRYGVVALLLGVGAVMPAGVGLLALEPAWALMYLAHPDHARAIVWPMVIVGLAGAPTLGLKVAQGLLTDRGAGRWWAWMGAQMGLLAFAVLAGMERLGTVAYYEGYHYGGRGVPLAASAMFWPLLVVSLALPLLMAYCLVQVQQHVALSEDVPAIEPEAIPFEAERTPA